MKTNGHVLKEIELSVEPKEIFSFLGYDHERFTQV